MSKDLLHQPVPDIRLFPTGEVYEVATRFAKTIIGGIEGRAIFDPHDAGILAQAVLNAKHGDHVEIGTFYGASAILVALVKKAFGMHGKVYCVDPLEVRSDVAPDASTGIMATQAIVMSNAEKFSVADRIVLVPNYSKPWPIDENKTFASGYIDGDHWNGFPLWDWQQLSKRVTYSIVFDDYAWGKTEVIDAVHVAMQDPNWICVHISGVQAVFRRRH